MKKLTLCLFAFTLIACGEASALLHLGGTAVLTTKLAPRGSNDAKAPNFVDNIKPLMLMYCTSCHSTQAPTAGLALDSLESSSPALSTADKWTKVLARMKAHSMPPSGHPQPTADDIDMVERWINAGRPYDSNSGQGAKAMPTHRPMRRLTVFELTNTLSDLFGADAVTSADSALRQFPAGEIDGVFDNVGPTVNENHVLALYGIVGSISDYLLSDLDRLSSLTGCQIVNKEIDASDACLAHFINVFGRRVYRRPVVASEVDKLLKLSKLTDKELKFTTVIKAMIMSPNFIYMIEGSGDVSSDGTVVKLSPFELASRLAYTLWRTMPDDALLDAAEQNALSTKAQLEAMVDRMLADSRARNGWEHFATQWFQIAANDLPSFDDRLHLTTDQLAVLRQSVVTEPVKVTSELVFGRGSNYGDLITTNLAYIDNPSLAEIYGIPGSSGFVNLADKERQGLLTRAGFLISGKKNSSAVLRGVPIRKRFLCDVLVQPAFDQATAMQVQTGLNDRSISPRERLTRLTDREPCTTCHVHINGAGFAFDGYDTFGRIRTVLDEYDLVNGSQAVVASFPINSVVAPSIDSPNEPEVDGGSAFSAVLANSKQGRMCFAQHWYEYLTDTMPTDETIGTVQSFYNSLQANNPKIIDFIKATVMADEFQELRL